MSTKSYTRTTGDDNGIRCPHCGGFNMNISNGAAAVPGKVTVIKKDCDNIACRKEIIYEIKFTPTLTAYSKVPDHIAEQYQKQKEALKQEINYPTDKLSSEV